LIGPVYIFSQQEVNRIYN